MFFGFPQNLILMIVGAFLLGWLLSSISGSFGSKSKAKKRDPRDDRIRSLEAELRVAQTDVESFREKVAALHKELEEVQDGVEKRDNVISHQQKRMEETTRDLKESVLKTRELRAELSERATENIKSEVKLREVETELEVAQASTDMIATGVLDYSVAPVEDVSENDDDEDLLDESDMTEAAT
jgi:chromosome segregation ATPase